MHQVISWNPEYALLRIRALAHTQGALLPILHSLQDQFGYIDEAAIPLIARELNLSQAEVHGVISFYHDFHRSREGTHVMKICRAEACQSMGCDALIGHIESKARVKLGETTRDGALTIKAVYCLGNCALSPALMLDGVPYGRVTAAAADKLLASTGRPS